MKIKAAVIEQKSGPFVIDELDLDAPGAGEVLVRIAGAGLCHTDLVCRDQYFPVPLPCVFGHEGSGVVEAVGPGVDDVAPGDHVVLSYASCGQCPPCLQGLPGYCLDLYGHNFRGTRADGTSAIHRHGTVVHGHFFRQSSFASHVIAGARNTVVVDRSAPLELLGPLGCGVQTGAGAVMNALRPQAGTSIVVFGAGSVGLSAVMAAQLVGCGTIVAVDPNAERLELAKELGATHGINPTEGDPLPAIGAATGGGAHYSLECTGLPQVLRQAVDCLTLTGICGLIGVSRLGTEVRLDMNAILFGRSLRGIIEGDSVPRIFIPRLIALYQAGRFPFDRLVRFYPLDAINEAVHDTESGRVLKAIMRP